MKNNILVFLAAVAAAAFAGCSPDAESGAPAVSVTASNLTLTAAQRQRIQVQTAGQSRFRKTVRTPGTVAFDSNHATTVLAPFSGPVSRLLVVLGDRVQAGQPLATVASPDFAAAISVYRKALATARTARNLADLDRELLQVNGVSQREAAQAQTDAVNAEADRDAALQALLALKVEPGVIKDLQAGRPIPPVEAVIRAPIAGTVVERMLTPGELLQAGTTPCFTVADLSNVWVMAHVFGQDLTAVSVGDTAEVETDLTTNRFPGTVDNVSALVDPNTRSVEVRVIARNPGEFLKKDMYVRVAIHSQRESAGLLVPVSAVLRDDDNLPFVYTENADGSFGRHRISLGSRVGDGYEVTSGLNAGDRVVVEGGLFMQFVQSQ